MRAKRPIIEPAKGESGGGQRRGTAVPAPTTYAEAASQSKTFVLQLAPGADVNTALKAYRADPSVVYAEPNAVGGLAFIPSDPLYSQTASDFALIGVEQAWDIEPGASPSVKVAVIDSGIDAGHPDLSGAIDLPDSFNFADSNTNIFDDIGHGTRVAGIIAASGNNAEGIAGIAFGCTILALDVAAADGTISTANVASAVNWAVSHGAQIINLSLRFNAPSQTLQEACDAASAAGALLIAAAGNENQGDAPVYPASFDSVMGVGALADDGLTRAPWSNFAGAQGQQLVELVAPGTTVFSTIPGGQYNGTFGSGTSYAAPMVAGVAALLKMLHPEQSGSAIRAHLKTTATPLPGFEPAGGAGAGRLNAAAALGTPMTPVLSIASVRVDDNPSYDAANDGDGALDHGERTKLIVTLAGAGGDASSVVGTLSTADPDVAPIFFATKIFGTVPSGGAASNAADPFNSIDLSLLVGVKQIPFDLTLTGNGGFSQTLHFTLATEAEFNISGVKISYPFTNTRTYHVMGNLLLREATTIPAGTVFKVDPGVDIQLSTNCALTAVGTAEQPIVFRSARPTTISPGLPVGPRSEPVNLADYQQVRYVSSSTGSDTTGNGSQATPWYSITFALNHITNASPSNLYALLVGEGTYAESTINLLPNVDLYGGWDPGTWQRDISTFPTVLDAGGAHTVVSAIEQANGKLDGFTIRGGKGVGAGSFAAGGIGTYATSPTISNNRIILNEGNDGAGIYSEYGSPIVRNNLIAQNSAGIHYVNTSGSPGITIVGNVISDYVLLDRADSLLADNIFLGNAELDLRSASYRIERCQMFGRPSPAGSGYYALVLQSAQTTLLNSSLLGYVGGMEAVFTSPGTVINCTISGNPNFGIYSDASSPLQIVNTIAKLNGPSNFNGAAIYSDIDGGVSGTGNINVDPAFLGLTAAGVARSVIYDAALAESRLEVAGSLLESENLAYRVLLIGSSYFCVKSNTATEIVIFGDVTSGGATHAPLTWSLIDYRLASNSPLRDAGIGPASDNRVPSSDFEGDPRSGNVTDVGMDEFNPASGQSSTRWGTLWVTSNAVSAQFDHIIVENGNGMHNQISNMAISNSILRANRYDGLSSDPLAAAEITSTTAELNLLSGIQALGSDLVNCQARFNGGKGLVGRAIINCVAFENGADGFLGTSATDSRAELNAGAGFVLTQGATRSTATNNQGAGMVVTGGNVSSSSATFNDGVGIHISSGGRVSNSTASHNGGGGVVTDGGIVENCTIAHNTGAGVTGLGVSNLDASRVIGNSGAAITGVAGVTNSAVASNGAGISGATVVGATYAGGNAGAGISGGAISNSTIVGNAGDGIRSPTSVANSWIMNNAGFGIVATDATGTVLHSSIRNNAGIGVRNILSASDSNIYGNGPVGGPFDASDNVVAGTDDRNLHNNYWGPANTTLLDAGQPFGNMPFLQDVLDGSGNHLIDIWPYLNGPALNAPDSAAPAFLLSVVPTAEEPVGVGISQFLLDFSRAMDTSASPSVTFDSRAPFTAHIVEGAPGWITPTRWVGTFAVQSDTGDGAQTLRVSGAKSATAFLIPDDTSHGFIVDTSGALAATNLGSASPVGDTVLELAWTEHNKPPTALGYNITRASSPAGPFQHISGPIVTTNSFTDTGLPPQGLFVYVVFLVDSSGNSIQWTPPFTGTTGVPTPTPTPTPTPSPSPTPLPPGGSITLDYTQGGGDPLGWLGGAVPGFGGSTSVGPGGLCMSVPGPGDNYVLWLSPERFIEILDGVIYRVRLVVTTDQTATDAIPLFFLAYDNFNAGGIGNNYGGFFWVLDVDGGAEGIGRAQGRSNFDFYIAPTAINTTQWMSQAFTPQADEQNDIRLQYRVIDANSTLLTDNDSGTICVFSAVIKAIDRSTLQVQQVTYNPPISSLTHFATALTDIGSGTGDIDDVHHWARFQLGTTGDVRRTLGPYYPGLPDLNTQLFPIIWEANTLYRVRTSIRAESSESDPIDAIFLAMEGTTHEIGMSLFSTRGAPGGPMDRAASPKLIGAEYEGYFYSQNVTASLTPNAGRLRPLAFFFNTTDQGGDGTGGDAFVVESFAVDHLVTPQ